MLGSTPFKNGDFVRRKLNPSDAGIVQSIDLDEQFDEWVIQVRFGTRTRAVAAAELELVPEEADHWRELEEGRCGTAAAFLDLITCERLRRPPARVAASFGSARVTLYPYQFKPLLKFLDNPGHRLLIADDVGLGKTIEAGYVLRELEAREALERALIVVPARLQRKWQEELRRRFDTPFDLVSARDFLRVSRQVERTRSSPTFRWITSYESLRRPDVIEAVEDLPFDIDVLIFDEAHRMRNADTLQHKLGRALGRSTTALLLLTATPVQTGEENLFNLFRILDEEMFSSFPLFQEQLRAQGPVLRLLREIREHVPDVHRVRICVEELQRDPLTKPLVDDEAFRSVRDRIDRIRDLERRQRVALYRDVTEMALTSTWVSRTRRVEVFENRPDRSSMIVRIKLSEPERAFYESVADMCRWLRPGESSWGLTMSILNAYRYTASSIPAAIDYLKARGAGGLLSLGGESAVEMEDAGGWLEPMEESASRRPEIPGDLAQRWNNVLDLLRDPPRIDTKAKQFFQAIEKIWESDDREGTDRRKIIVFSYFKRTLRHLERACEERGLGCRRIDGDVPLSEREERIDDFAQEPTVKILLSSEVGSEGIDLQFASVVVNYDLPWNPMVVEQRIGRVDRIGQRASRILILNLVLEGTIEERILMRLYERIKIFEETVGELDPIIGETIAKLTIEALSGRLSEDEQRRRAEKAGEALWSRLQEARRVSEKADTLLAADQAFLDEIEELLGGRRLPTARDLCRLVQRSLGDRYPGSRLPSEAVESVVMAHLDKRCASDLQKHLGAGLEVQRVGRLIASGPLPVTFDPQAAASHARAELIHRQHPLLRLIQRLKEGANGEHRVFALELAHGAITPSQYVLSIHLYETLDEDPHRSRTDLVAFGWDLIGKRLLPRNDAQLLYTSLLDESNDVDPLPAVDSVELGHARVALESEASTYRAQLRRSEADSYSLRMARRRVTLESTLRARLKSATGRREELETRRAATFAVEMARRKEEKARSELEAFLGRTRDSPEPRLESHELALVLVAVRSEAEV